MSSGRRPGADEYSVISGGASDPKWLGGTTAPTAGVTAPEGSIYTRFVAGAGELWIKVGAANTAWAPLTPNLGFFGDGSDGDVVLGAPATLTRDMYYNSLDLDGNDLDADGYRVFVRNTLTIPTASSIYRMGGNPSGETGGAANPSRTIGGSMVGGDGAIGAGNNGGQASKSQGGAGGDGGAGSGGAGGTGPAPILLGGYQTTPHAPPNVLTGWYYEPGAVCDAIMGGCGGGGGGGDGAANEGGGGGGGGGCVLVFARNIIIAAGGAIRSRAAGGANGTATDCGGGGGGGGGMVIVGYETLANAGDIESAGGTGGASGGGAGVAGGNGASGTVILYPVI